MQECRQRLITLFVIAGLAISATSTFGQGRGSSYQPRYSKLTFSQDLNIFEWLYTLNYQKTLNNKLQIRIKEDFRSTLQSISSQDLWKDNQNLTVALNYQISKQVSFEPEILSHILKDPLAGFDNDLTFHSGTAKITYQPNSKVQLSPKISSKWQTQFEQSDQGFGYGINATLYDFDVNGYRNDLSVIGEQDFFPRRRNEDLRVRYQIKRKFYEATADTLVIVFDRLRRDTFGADTSGIFVRNLAQSNRGFENYLSYRLGSNTTVFLKNSILATTFKVTNLKEEEDDIRKDDSGFESRHSVRLSVNKPRWNTNIGWNYRFRSRDDRRQDLTPDPFGRHPSVGFDIEDVFVELNLRSGYKLSSSDSVGFFAAVSKFQYDTSDTTNSNDHDQIRWQATFSHGHEFSPSLRLVWRGSVFLNHFVFISGKFSGGNNWERVFQLKPEIVYRPSHTFYSKQSFIVRAKYRTFDFDDPTTSNRNIVNRQFILANESKIGLSRKSWIELRVNFELAEQGRLFYSLWRQNLALSWRNQEAKVIFRHRIGSDLTIALGGKFFQQSRWQHRINSQGVSEKKLQEKHTNYGPIMEASYRPSSSVEFLFLGNIQIVNSSRRNADQINNFDVNLNWYF